MQLKTCTNPDRIMKYRHKILHSMEIAFSHVLWFEKKRENDSQTDGDTQGEEKERGKKKRDGDARGESAAARWSPTELRRGSGRARGRRLVFSPPVFHVSASVSADGWPWVSRAVTWAKRKSGDLPHPGLNLGVWGFFFYIYFCIFCI